MEKNFVSYYDGTSARPQEVWVLVNRSGVHLYDEEDKYLKSFPLSNTIFNKTGSRHFLYLDPTGLQYLQFPEDHPLSYIIAKELPYAKMNWGQRLMKQRIIVLVPILLG